MEKKNLTVNEWCRKFNQGTFDSKDVNVQCEAGWYDWFCKDSSLAARTAKLGTFLLRIRDSKKITDDLYVWFKNNCPMSGGTYDDIRLSSKSKDGENQYVISFNSPHEKTPVAIYHVPTSAENPVFKGTAQEAVKWFNVLSEEECKRIEKEIVEQANAESEERLYEICDSEHASCNDACPVYRASGSKVPDTAHDFEKNRGCDCFKNGKAMREFLAKKEAENATK